MRKTFFVLSIILSAVIANAQNITVSFTGITQNGEYQRLDSVAIHNYSQGWDRTAIYPDTVMVAIHNGIGGSVVDAEMLSCAPNPFDGETDFVVNLPQEGAVLIKVFDVSGRMFAEYNGYAIAGANMFGISLSQPNVYFLSVTANGTTTTIKLMNTGNGGSDRIWSKGAAPTEKIVVSGDFNMGDLMKYIGYTTHNGTRYESLSVTQPQNISENILLEFDLTPCPDIPVYSEVEINTCADPFVYNGITYTESGSYQQTLTTINGCDSVVLLFLHLGSGVYDERDGNSYCSIMLGEQEWLSENMRYLPSVNYVTDASVVNAKYYVYGYDGTDVNEARNSSMYSEYGVLYNWQAAQTACPAGWHLPSDAEWSQLEIFLQNNGFNYDDYIDTDNDRETHNVIAKSLASTSGWRDSEIENTPGWLQPKNNTSSFNGKPAGCKVHTAVFGDIRERTWWWSTTTQEGDSDSAWDRRLKYDLEELSKTHNHKSIGVSVRCVRN